MGASEVSRLQIASSLTLLAMTRSAFSEVDETWLFNLPLKWAKLYRHGVEIQSPGN
jgi:hypothetical protein